MKWRKRIRLSTFLKSFALVGVTLVCHSVLTVYHGFTTIDCSGKKTRFESWASLSESDPPIRSYRWGSDEALIDEIDCKKVYPIENITVTEESTDPLILDEILYDPSDSFFTDANWSSEWKWSVRYAETKIAELEQCLRSKIDDVLSDDEALSLLSDDVKKTLGEIEESEYDVVVGDPGGEDIGGFYSYDPPTIHIDVLEILFL